MVRLTQKWCIVSLLENVDEGHEFDMNEWPLHLTFVGVHDADWKNAELMDSFANSARKQSPFTSKGLHIGNLGPEDNPTTVTFIDMNKEVLALHHKLIESLEAHGASFNNPEFNKEGFIAHSTVQKHAKIKEGQAVAVTNLALIDMFPNQDGNRRKIVKVLHLSGSR